MQESKSTLMTIRDVEQELCCSRTTVYRLLDNGSLKSIHIGRVRRITRKSFDDFVSTHLKDASISDEAPTDADIENAIQLLASVGYTVSKT